ncbi:Peptidyl-prolyl cis-trans isomerase FKBP62 [Platanthera guangdongensis]|uniref:Peptidyl-prolyl cis-trans isomerase FKBP62 n=1 Tax=Platanthera guangdongensis TaxID=2320717 RepID=A0ABR2LV45_9ASPA
MAGICWNPAHSPTNQTSPSLIPLQSTPQPQPITARNFPGRSKTPSTLWNQLPVGQIPTPQPSPPPQLSSGSRNFSSSSHYHFPSTNFNYFPSNSPCPHFKSQLHPKSHLFPCSEPLSSTHSGFPTLQLEVFKKSLMQSLQEESESPQVGASKITEMQISKASSLSSGSPMGVKYEASLEDGALVSKVDEGIFCLALAKAVKTMKKGEKGRPASVGEGVVPANATLLIELELLSWKTVTEIRDDKKVLKKILKEGEGVRFAYITLVVGPSPDPRCAGMLCKKGSLDASVEVLSCELEVTGLSPESNLLQKCKVSFRLTVSILSAHDGISSEVVDWVLVEVQLWVVEGWVLTVVGSEEGWIGVCGNDDMGEVRGMARRRFGPMVTRLVLLELLW